MHEEDADRAAADVADEVRTALGSEKLKANAVEKFAKQASEDLAPIAKELADAAGHPTRRGKEAVDSLLARANESVRLAAVQHEKVIVATGIADKIEQRRHDILKTSPSAIPKEDLDFLEAAGSKRPRQELARGVRKSRLAYFEEVSRPSPVDAAARLRSVDIKLGSDGAAAHRKRVFRIARKLVLGFGLEAWDLYVLVKKANAVEYDRETAGAALSLLFGIDQIYDALDETW